jgi:hypothetical protein
MPFHRNSLWSALGAAALASCGMGDPPPLDNRGISDGSAVAKFCHDLHRSTSGIDLTLVFGNPPLAQISATTGNCTPPLGETCMTIPVGVVPLKLMEGDRELASGAIRLTSNLEYVFAAVVSGQTGQPTVRNGVFKPEFKCAVTDPRIEVDAGPRDGAADASDGGPDGGAPDGSAEAGAPDAAAIDAAAD